MYSLTKSQVYKTGLITEGCVVLVTGDFDDRILVVKTIGFPPFESSAQSRAHFNTANTFGGSHPVSLKLSEKLKLYEEKHSEEIIVLISELWLDNQIVLEKFRSMLEEFCTSPPLAFVICGNFLSFPPNVTSAQKLKEGFKRLSDVVNAFPPIVKDSKFVLIPGPYDPGAPRILPRPPLPGFVVEDFVKTIPGTILATNPCRIQYCTKEIVVFREDILHKLCRNTFQYPEAGKVAEDVSFGSENFSALLLFGNTCLESWIFEACVACVKCLTSLLDENRSLFALVTQYTNFFFYFNVALLFNFPVRKIDRISIPFGSDDSADGSSLLETRSSSTTLSNARFNRSS